VYNLESHVYIVQCVSRVNSCVLVLRVSYRCLKTKWTYFRYEGKSSIFWQLPPLTWQILFLVQKKEWASLAMQFREVLKSMAAWELILCRWFNWRKVHGHSSHRWHLHSQHAILGFCRRNNALTHIIWDIFLPRSN